MRSALGSDLSPSSSVTDSPPQHSPECGLLCHEHLRETGCSRSEGRRRSSQRHLSLELSGLRPSAALQTLCSSSPSPSLCADEVGYCHDLSSIFKTLKTLLHWCLGPPCSQLSFSIFWRWVLPFPTLQSRSSLISLSHPFVNSN